MTACAAPRHDGQAEPTPAEPAARLCRPCRTGLARDLAALPVIDAQLAVLTLLRGNPGNGGTPIPFDPAITEWRAQFRRNITRATRDVAAERRWRLPADHPYAMCAWLEPQVRWASYRDWAPRLAGALHHNRTHGEQLRSPVVIKHIFLPGACLACGNGRMQAVIYADHAAGRWSYWVCPACTAVTEIEAWWDYRKRVAALREAG